MYNNEIINMYSYICKKGIDGVLVDELLNRFKVKKKDIVNFLKSMSQFSDNINFYYYSIKEDEYLDSFEDINEDTMIEINDNMFNVTVKLELSDTLRLYEIIEDSNIIMDKNIDFIYNIGDFKVENFKYINKGTYRKSIDEKIIKLKDIIVDAIIENSNINIEYYKNSDLTMLKFIIPLGVYYDISKEQFYIVLKCHNEIYEIKISDIKHIEICTSENILEDLEFNINTYLKEKRTEKLVLRVYNEARVISKVENLFSDYDYEIEDRKDYFKFSINVEEPMDFKWIIDSFGMSVIVEEPIKLRDIIIEEARVAINNYKMA